MIPRFDSHADSVVTSSREVCPTQVDLEGQGFRAGRRVALSAGASPEHTQKPEAPVGKPPVLARGSEGRVSCGFPGRGRPGTCSEHTQPAYDPALPLLAGVHSVMSPQPDPDAFSPCPPELGPSRPHLFRIHAPSVSPGSSSQGEEGHPAVPLAAAALPLDGCWPSWVGFPA